MTGSEDKPHRHKSKMELIMMKTGAREQDNVIQDNVILIAQDTGIISFQVPHGSFKRVISLTTYLDKSKEII